MKVISAITVFLMLMLGQATGYASQLEACITDDCKTYHKKFKRAAKRGHSQAQYHLAKFYYYGYGTEVNKELALKYYRKSAVNGVKEAQYMTGLIYVTDDTLGDYQQGLYWLERSALNGHIHAAFLLGKVNAKGNERPNYPESDKWLARAFDIRYDKLPALVVELNQAGILNENNFPKLYNKLIEHNMWLNEHNQLSNWTGKSYERITVIGYSQEVVFDNLLASFRGRNNSTGSRLNGDCFQKAGCQRKSLNEMKDSIWVSRK